MDRPNLPLTALRAFEVAARQGSFTSAAVELCVSQAAVSHQIISLEKMLGVQLFKRTSGGLVMTEEGAALLPVLTSAFDQFSNVLDRFLDGQYRETLNVGVVTTFAAGWLLDRMPEFTERYPSIDLRISTNNNRADLVREGLDMAIKFGNAAWQGLTAIPILEAPLTPLCSIEVADRLTAPRDLASENLLRSYRADEWPSWFAQQQLACPDIRGPVFDSSVALAEIAAKGLGVALLPFNMFEDYIESQRLVRPFPSEVSTGSYWLVHLKTKTKTPAMTLFQEWLVLMGDSD